MLQSDTGTNASLHQHQLYDLKLGNNIMTEMEE